MIFNDALLKINLTQARNKMNICHHQHCLESLRQYNKKAKEVINIIKQEKGLSLLAFYIIDYLGDAPPPKKNNRKTIRTNRNSTNKINLHNSVPVLGSSEMDSTLPAIISTPGYRSRYDMLFIWSWPQRPWVP